MYKMESYCLKCRKYTENINPQVSSTSNGKIMIFSRCAICNTKNCKFIKKKQAKGLLTLFVLERGEGGQYDLPPSLSPHIPQFFCDNLFSKNATKLKFSDLNCMFFRHILAKFHIMYPRGSNILAILLDITLDSL